MSFSESSFRTALMYHQLSFRQVCKQLTIAVEESEQNQSPLAISEATQSLISIDLRRLLPNFFCRQATYQVSVSNLDIIQWTASLAHFNASLYRDALLKDTATLIRRTASNQFSSQAISGILYNLRMFPTTQETQAILRAVKKHLIVHKFEPWLNPDELSSALYGLQKMQNCPEVNSILEELYAQFIATRASGKWLKPYNIGRALYGLKSLSICVEVKDILIELTLHLKVNAEEGKWLRPQDMSIALYGLKNKDCPEVTAILIAMQPHLVTSIHGKKWFNLSEISDVLEGVNHLKSSAEVKGIFSILQYHLDHNLDLGRNLTLQQLYQALRLLDSMQDYVDIKAAQDRLSYYLNAVPKIIDVSDS
jgi:hypothetical protein